MYTVTIARVPWPQDGEIGRKPLRILRSFTPLKEPKNLGALRRAPNLGART